MVFREEETMALLIQPCFHHSSCIPSANVYYRAFSCIIQENMPECHSLIGYFSYGKVTSPLIFAGGISSS